MNAMNQLLDLQKYPLHQPESYTYKNLLIDCREELQEQGMFNLHGLLRPESVKLAAEALKPKIANEAFIHSRSHNVYFEKSVPELPAEHPALARLKTSNRTLCADQLAASVVIQIYEWPPLAKFIASVMDKAELYVMQDLLARVNVMAYGSGDTLNWHFDRSEFTTTLLLQAPTSGGVFEYRQDLRCADKPNYAAVAKLLSGEDKALQQINVNAGTLNVFRGVNTAHRVTTVGGERDRIIAVFSYFDRPDVVFSEEEQLGFYGRSLPHLFHTT